jgi:8-oxo-dGTP pyrophosphatase MutT (NUDIX family)
LWVAQKKQSIIFPGEKHEQGESDLECLCREVEEEFPGTQLKDITFYDSFIGRTPHSGDIFQAEHYFAVVDGEIGSVRPGDSISKSFFTEDVFSHNLSDITYQVAHRLVADGYLSKQV